jgi:hypothetical protein
MSNPNAGAALLVEAEALLARIGLAAANSSAYFLVQEGRKAEETLFHSAEMRNVLVGRPPGSLTTYEDLVSLRLGPLTDFALSVAKEDGRIDYRLRVLSNLVVASSIIKLVWEETQFNDLNSYELSHDFVKALVGSTHSWKSPTLDVNVIRLRLSLAKEDLLADRSLRGASVRLSKKHGGAWNGRSSPNLSPSECQDIFKAGIDDWAQVGFPKLCALGPLDLQLFCKQKGAPYSRGKPKPTTPPSTLPTAAYVPLWPPSSNPGDPPLACVFGANQMVSDSWWSDFVINSLPHLFFMNYPVEGKAGRSIRIASPNPGWVFQIGKEARAFYVESVPLTLKEGELLAMANHLILSMYNSVESHIIVNHSAEIAKQIMPPIYLMDMIQFTYDTLSSGGYSWHDDTAPLLCDTKKAAFASTIMDDFFMSVVTFFHSSFAGEVTKVEWSTDPGKNIIGSFSCGQSGVHVQPPGCQVNSIKHRVITDKNADDYHLVNPTHGRLAASLRATGMYQDNALVLQERLQRFKEEHDGTLCKFSGHSMQLQWGDQREKFGKTAIPAFGGHSGPTPSIVNTS